MAYTGLSRLKALKKTFRNITLRHSYKSVYSVGSYSSYRAYNEFMGGLGFITDVTTGNPVPSCPYDISTVSINESFSPLFGLDVTFNNNITAKAEYRRTRVLTLSMSAMQITETRSNDLVIGAGYKITGLNLFAPKRTVKAKKRGSKKHKKSKSRNAPTPPASPTTSTSASTFHSATKVRSIATSSPRSRKPRAATKPCRCRSRQTTR